MKKKTKKLETFLEGLHKHITTDPQFRKDTRTKSEREIQTEIRPLIINYLAEFYKDNYRDSWGKANKSFYWEGQEGKYGKQRRSTFASRNYPDFIITDPYLIAIEYKKSDSGSAIKHGIGQSLIHTMCEEFHYVYFLFHDQTKDKDIAESFYIEPEKRFDYVDEKPDPDEWIEREVSQKMWDDFNIMVKLTLSEEEYLKLRPEIKRRK